MARCGHTYTLSIKRSKRGSATRSAARRLDQIGQEVGARIDDDYLRILCDEHYELKALKDQGVNLEALISLLVEARKEDSDPVAYLGGLLEQKRTFKQSYEKRHQGKDYSAMSMTDLRNTKTTEAAHGIINFAGDPPGLE